MVQQECQLGMAPVVCDQVVVVKYENHRCRERSQLVDQEREHGSCHVRNLLRAAKVRESLEEDRSSPWYALARTAAAFALYLCGASKLRPRKRRRRCWAIRPSRWCARSPSPSSP